MTETIAAWSETALRAAQAQMPGPAPLQAWRQQQLQEFAQRGLPQRGHESWRYTPLNTLLAQSFTLAKSTQQNDAVKLTVENLAGDYYRLTFIDGVFSPHHSLLSDLPQKVILTTGSAMLAQQPDFYQQQSVASVSQNLSVFYWLNGAFLNDGLFLTIAPGVILTKPIHLLYLSTEVSAATMRHPRHRIVLGKDSQVSILEDYRSISANGGYFNNVMTQISVEANARLRYYKLQREAVNAWHISNTHIIQARDSQVSATHIALGAQLHREDLQLILQDSGAECQISGLYYPQAGQHIDFHTRIDHQWAHTHSRQYYKGMIGAQGHGVFNGKIIIHPQSQHVVAEQENHNLLLGAAAAIDTKPELEVYADNVQCTHGATVGDLDAQALFYLRSRGITEKLARHLLMCGFVDTILKDLPDPMIAELIRQEIEAHHAS